MHTSVDWIARRASSPHWVTCCVVPLGWNRVGCPSACNVRGHQTKNRDRACVRIPQRYPTRLHRVDCMPFYALHFGPASSPKQRQPTLSSRHVAARCDRSRDDLLAGQVSGPCTRVHTFLGARSAVRTWPHDASPLSGPCCDAVRRQTPSSVGGRFQPELPELIGGLRTVIDGIATTHAFRPIPPSTTSSILFDVGILTRLLGGRRPDDCDDCYRVSVPDAIEAHGMSS